MFDKKKIVRFYVIASLALGYLYLEKLKNESGESENA